MDVGDRVGDEMVYVGDNVGITVGILDGDAVGAGVGLFAT